MNLVMSWEVEGDGEELFHDGMMCNQRSQWWEFFSESLLVITKKNEESFLIKKAFNCDKETPMIV